MIAGPTARTVLLRATGPSLTAFNLTGVLADPQLILTNIATNPGTVVSTQTGWNGDSSVRAVGASVGAFSWGATATGDSAITLTLPPGNYTVGVVGAKAEAGLTLVEVYEVP